MHSSPKTRHRTIADSQRIRDRRSRIFVGTIPMVYRRAHLFVAGHTFYWCTADRWRFRMRDEMTSENLSSVIYDAPRRTGASDCHGKARSRRSTNSSRSTYVWVLHSCTMRGLPILILLWWESMKWKKVKRRR